MSIRSYQRTQLLLVERDPEVLNAIAVLIPRDEFDVHTTSELDVAAARLKSVAFDIVLMSVALAQEEDGHLFGVCKQYHESMPVLFLCEFSIDGDFAERHSLRAADFVVKPARRPDLLAALERALERRQAEPRTSHIYSGESNDPFLELLGNSAAMRPQVEKAKLLADSKSAVLITGETGTGKELMARAVHMAGPRSTQRFVTAFMPTITESLFNSELFGHIKGAFSSAEGRRLGMFREAHRGTMFLDEIADIPIQLQVSLLRAIEYKQIRPVGADGEIQVDVRIIAATNRNLGEAVDAGRFRADLFHRLNGSDPIHMPPLRERKEDIAELLVRLSAEFGGRIDNPPDSDIVEKLRSYQWPGNVRELRSVIERASCLAGGGNVTAEHFLTQLQASPRQLPDNAGSEVDSLLDMPWDAANAAFQKRYWLRAIEWADGDRERLAKFTKLHRATVNRKLRELGEEDGSVNR